MVNAARRSNEAGGREVVVRPYRVGILGATGLVGQRLLQRLAAHPWFEIAALAASDRSAGRRYADAARWSISADPPPGIRDLVVRRCRPDELADVDLVLSALDSQVASQIEPLCASAGLAVVSNSSAFRQLEDVPLLIPEINASHVDLLRPQQQRTAAAGFIVTNPNCSTTGLALAVAPLHRAFGLRRVVVTTLQAISGAGMEGPRALELVDNVLPYIPGEEEKIETELGKILGTVERDVLRREPIAVSAHCHRVAALDGHLAAVSLELERAVAPEEAARALREFSGDVQGYGLPSAPARPIVVREEPDRPQPRLDRDAGDGMSVVVGRVRRCAVLGLRLEILSHNTVRGAAGGTLLNAELLAALGRLPRRVAV